MHKIIQQLVNYTNVSKVLLLQQTLRTAQLVEQVKRDKAALEAAVEHIRLMGHQLAEYERLLDEANTTIKALAAALGIQTTDDCGEERYG